MNKRKRAGLDSGFVFLYDWLPAFSDLDGEDFKRLLLALIDRQRNGTPLPRFENKQVTIYAQMIEPVIVRRLDGQRGGYLARDGQANAYATVVPAIVPMSNMVQAREEERRERERYKREGARARAQTDVCADTRADAHVCAREAPPPRESVIASLDEEGIPKLYVAERYARAIERGGNVVEILRSWWATDQAEWEKLHGSEIVSFDTDDFFEVALRRSYGGAYASIDKEGVNT